MVTFSILMPAYNVEKYISKAIDSVIAQTYDEWELIIVDDASIDRTGEIVKVYAADNTRIRYHRNEKNSGNTSQPRLKAATFATGKFISILDADDTIETQFLEKLLLVHERTNADIVISQMIIIDINGNELERIPKVGFDILQILTGKEACSKTIGGWEIGFNGSSSYSSLYKSLLNRETYQEMNAEEVNTRLYLLKANKVAFSDAIYYYLYNTESITKKPSLKYFDRLDTSFQLIDIVEDHYSLGSVEYKKQYKECLTTMMLCYLYVRKYKDHFTNENREQIDAKVKCFYSLLYSKPKPSLKLPFKLRIINSNWRIFLFVMRIKYIKKRILQTRL